MTFLIIFKGSDNDGNVAKLNMKNVGGVFVVLAGGCGVAMIQGIFKWICNIKKLSRDLEVNFPSSTFISL